MESKKKQYLLLVKVLMIFTAFALYFSLSCFLPVDYAPDEHMRYKVPEYIYTNHVLPIGTEPAILDEKWGFSYAFTPYLPSILAAGMMKLVSLFSDSRAALIIASRFVSVAAGTASVGVAFQIGEKLFDRWGSILLFVTMIAFLPQFVFLTSYLNNDVLAVFSILMIFASWLYGKENHWNYKACIYLGVGISICVLTYYNAYGWILCSIFYVIVTIRQDSAVIHKIKYMIPRGAAVFGIVMALAGWFFVRNMILYQGDFLGLDAMYACGEQYALDIFKPSNRQVFFTMGLPFYRLFLDTDWLSLSIESFFAIFGYMDIKVPDFVYPCYYGFISLGSLGYVWGILKKKVQKSEIVLHIMCFICIVIPIILSVYYSYTIDHQPQGRYFMPGLPAFMFLITKGYSYLDEGFKAKGLLNILAVGIWLFLFLYCWFTTMLPRLYLGI